LTGGATRFALAYDPAEAVAALRKDRDLRRVIARVGEFRLALRPNHSPFEALAESIVYQQLNGKVAATIWGRTKDLFEARHLRPEDVLGAPMPTLRGAGLSEAKALALKDLALKAEEGLVPGWAALRKLDDEEIIRRFIQVRGIGRWTVEMLLIFRLGRPDVWPVDDFAVRTAYGDVFGFGKVDLEEMRARAEAWRPWRTVVAWYLWRWYQP
jgi:3-methyladenine DNA glycosylase/8-oxoguanine DNA glycosylase